MKKLLKGFLFALGGILILVNLVILFSGKWYIYTAVAKTYFIGQKGPDIYDLNLFEKRVIPSSKSTQHLIDASSTTHFQLSVADQKVFNEIQTTSFLILKDDSILVEKYWGTHEKTTLSNSFSVAKSYIGTLIGIAVGEGKISSLDAKVGDYLPAFKKGKLNAVTIRNLLSMSSGLSWSESGGNPFSNNAEGYYGSELEQLATNQTLESEPGKIFNYQSGNTEVLALVLEKATGKNVSTYLEEKIWSKIDTHHDAYWSLDHAKGHEKAFCCLYATTRDFAQFGRLILQNGVWNGDTLIPSWYLREMMQNTPMQTSEGIPNTRYGLQWWTYRTAEDTVFYARGILGQYIMVLPKQHVVIVRTGHKRLPNYEGEDAAKVGHPKDLFLYLQLVKKMLNDRKKHA